jgi:hypothetical protein
MNLRVTSGILLAGLVAGLASVYGCGGEKPLAGGAAGGGGGSTSDGAAGATAGGDGAGAGAAGSAGAAGAASAGAAGSASAGAGGTNDGSAGSTSDGAAGNASTGAGGAAGNPPPTGGAGGSTGCGVAAGPGTGGGCNTLVAAGPCVAGKTIGVTGPFGGGGAIVAGTYELTGSTIWDYSGGTGGTDFAAGKKTIVISDVTASSFTYDEVDVLGNRTDRSHGTATISLVEMLTFVPTCPGPGAAGGGSRSMGYWVNATSLLLEFPQNSTELVETYSKK